MSASRVGSRPSARLQRYGGLRWRDESRTGGRLLSQCETGVTTLRITVGRVPLSMGSPSGWELTMATDLPVRNSIRMSWQRSEASLVDADQPAPAYFNGLDF